MLKEAKEFKKSYPKKRNPPRVPDEQGRWKCNKCGQMLSEDAFSSSRSGGRYIPSAYCKECQRRHKQHWRRELRGNLQQILNHARSRARNKPWNCTLTWDDLFWMLKCQRARCACSGVPMQVRVPNSHWRMSLERKNNSKGYSGENCVFVAAEFNTCDYSQANGVDQTAVRGTAQWSPEKVQAVFGLRQQKVDLEALSADIQEAHHRPKLRRRVYHAKLPAGPTPPEPGQIYCGMCSTYLDPVRFTPSEGRHGGRCQACMRKYHCDYYSTLRGHVSNLCCGARRRAKRKRLEYSLTREQVLDMLGQQGGRCYYSGVPLEYKRIHRDWRMSIERLDNSKGYTSQNCVLIAVEFNTADQSRNTAVTEVFGTAQWSREKAEHIWGKAGWARKTHAGQPARPSIF
eukprot:Skav232928  [mRNA]  locus=scaffold1477:1059796:1060998:- [translate_table: standard]